MPRFETTDEWTQNTWDSLEALSKEESPLAGCGAEIPNEDDISAEWAEIDDELASGFDLEVEWLGGRLA